MIIINLVIFVVVGLALALFGGGGAIILIPYLKQVLGFPVDQAALLSLITIGINTGLQTIQDRKTIAWKPAAIFSLFSFPVAILSAQYLAPITPDSLRMIIFGIFTLSVALTMLLRKMEENSGHRTNRTGLVIAAITTGIICGLVGVGGGIFIAPTLIIFYGLTIKQSIKTSLAIVAFQSIAALGAYINRGVTIESSFLLYTLVFIAIGFTVGKKIKQFLPDQKLKRGFAIFLLVIGIWILIKP